MLRRLLPSAALRLQTPARSSAFRRMLCTARSSSDGGMQTHFRNSQSVHPLGIDKKRIETVEETGEWINPTTNHVWSEDEIKERLEFQPRHQPENLADRTCIGFLKVAHLPCFIYPKGRASRGAACVIAHDVRSIHPGQVAYWTFNKVTGYKAADPTPESVAFRLIFLESVAAVPGMVAAQHRHFRSLRKCAPIPASMPSPSSSPQACPAIGLAALARRPTQR